MSTKNAAGIALAALVGAAAGVVAGILVAPRSGSETRERMAQAAGQTWGEIIDGVEVNVGVACDEAAQTAQEASEKTDELREKVEAARARMSQVRDGIARASEHLADAAPAAQDVPADQAVPEDAADKPAQAE